MAVTFSLGNRIWETSTTATTGGTINLAGAQSGYKRFRDEHATGSKVLLCLYDGTSGQYEFSHGTLTHGTPDTISSRTVLWSSSGSGVPIAWGAGTRNAVCGPPGSEVLCASNSFQEMTPTQLATALTTLGGTTTGKALFTTASASAARTTLGLGTAAVLNVGTSASNIPQLDGSARLPAVDGSLLTNIAAVPAGTRMLFVQASAPAGWTKLTTNNDRTILITSGVTGGGTGGNWVPASDMTVGDTTLTISQIPSHSHTMERAPSAASGAINMVVDFGSGVVSPPWDTGSAGSGDPHTHTISSGGTWRPQHVLVIECSKN